MECGCARVSTREQNEGRQVITKVHFFRHPVPAKADKGKSSAIG